MTAGVMENLALLAGAPGGITKLRQLVRDLGVSGRLMADALPDEWQTVRLADLVLSFQNGVSSRGASKGVLVTVLRLADIKNGSICLDDSRQLTLDEHSIEKYRLVAGDVLVIRVNGSADLVGRFVVCDSDVGLHCDHFIRLRLDLTRVSASYLKLIGNCTATRAAIQDLFVSTAGQKTVNQTHIGSLSFLLPPLPEQHRIVAKVDELMALCDRLEARQQDAEAAHERLVKVLLDGLTRARDAEEFQTYWRQLAGQFESIFTSEESVNALRRAVLQLGVFGRLATGDAGDEPADRLLANISGRPAMNDAEPLPLNWCWTRFSAICQIRTELVRPEDHQDWPQVAPDCIEKGTGRLIEKRTVREAAIRGPNSRFQAGQLIYSKIRPSLSKVVLVDFAGLCSADMYPIDSRIDSRYQLYLMLSEPFLAQVRVAENRVKMPKLNQESLNDFLVPLPPLAEQRRIVAKVTELLALCDRLKARIAAARAKQAQLAEVLVRAAAG